MGKPETGGVMLSARAKESRIEKSSLQTLSSGQSPSQNSGWRICDVGIAELTGPVRAGWIEGKEIQL
jgi:hypothetical protein